MTTAINLKKFDELYSPVKNAPWNISIEEVYRALFAIDLISPAVPIKKTTTRKQHIARIAWLSAYGFSQSPPVIIDLDKKKPIRAGHHYIIAGLIRGNPTMTVKLSGTRSDKQKIKA